MSKKVWGDQSTQFFYDLTPDTVLSAIEALGYRTTGRCLALNSMENRVYEVEIEVDESKVNSPSDHFIVTKFYRPARWTKEQILDEHNFLFDLVEQEVPVVAPIKFDGESLFECPKTNLFYTVFPKKGGRIPDEMNHLQIEIMGRMLARLHNVGAQRKAEHRIQISPETFAKANLEQLLKTNLLPKHFEESYQNLVTQLIQLIKPKFDSAKNIRIHGDCHWGNIIWREDEGPFFVDFDDMLTGPAVQDIWLVVPGRDQEAILKRQKLLECYQQLRDFDHREIKLIEPLRTLRYIHFTTWISKRWEDQSFKNSFPQFGTEQYWQNQTQDLRHQISLIQEESFY
jgi:Ser/Thr protein kinase RdoA (MazF antagonist)